MKILKQILWNCIQVWNQVNRNFLSDWQKEIFSEYLDLLDLSTANNYLLLALNLRASQMLCNNWITVELNAKTNVPINLYAISLLPTWTWKDSTVKRLDDFIFNKFNNMFEKQADWYVEIQNKKVVDFARTEFDSKAEQDKYIKNNYPRSIAQDLWTATTEWLIDMRAAMESAGFWATSLVIWELWEYILNQKNDSWLLETYLHIYDFWNSAVKLIKWDKKARAVKWVPATMMLYSSPEKLWDWPWKEKLKWFLNQWFARRTFMCIPEKEEFSSNKKTLEKLESVEDYRKYKKDKLAKENTAYENAEKISEKILNIYIKTKPTVKENFENSSFWKNTKNTYKKLKFSEDSRFVYEAYFDYCKNSIDIFSKWTEEWVAWELTNRSWKALKLAWVIAAMEHPENLTISEKDIRNAIYQTEYFWQHVDRFYNKKLEDDVDKLFNFFVKNLWKEVIKKDIRWAGLVWQNRFSMWFDWAIKELSGHAEINWYKLFLPKELKKKHIKNWDRVWKSEFYKLEKIENESDF